MSQCRRTLYFVAATMVVASLAVAGDVTLRPAASAQFRQEDPSRISGAAVEFDLSAIPADVTIEMAELTIRADIDTAVGAAATVWVFPATGTWEGSTLELTSAIAFSDTLSTGNLASSGTNVSTVFPVTQVVRAWHSGGLPNDGFVLTLASHDLPHFTLIRQGDTVEVWLRIIFSK